MKKSLCLLILSLFLFSFSWSQKGDVIMSGMIEEGQFETNKKRSSHLSGVEIEMYENQQFVKKISLKRSSKYEIVLDPDVNYWFKFTKSGFVSKIIEVSTENMPVHFIQKGFDLQTDVTLYKVKKTEEITAYAKIPVAKCSYQRKKNALIWDMEYSTNAFRTFRELVFSSKNTMDVALLEKEQELMDLEEAENELLDLKILNLIISR